MDLDGFNFVSPSSYIITFKVSSALVEGLVSLILDILLLALLEKVCQCICSNHSLWKVFDKRSNLHIHSSTVLFTSEGPVGQRWLTRYLSIFISICAICTIILGFTINGRSDNQYFGSSYGTVVHIPNKPRPLDLDYMNEYRVAPNQNGKRPEFISKRLAALPALSLCQRCDYTHCEFLGYAMPNEKYGTDLANAETVIRNLNSTCISEDQFSSDLVSWRYSPTEAIGVHCELTKIKTKVSASNPMGDGETQVVEKSCDLERIEMMKCFYRAGYPIHCAGIGRFKETGSMHLIVANDLNDTNIQVTPSIIRAKSMSFEHRERYLENIAFMASIDLDAAWKLDLMAVAKLSYNVKLQVRDMGAEEIYVTDIDTRIALPCTSIPLLGFLILLIFSFFQWIIVVYKKQRWNCNRFASVSDFLQLIFLTGGTMEDRDLLKGYFSVVINNKIPTLSVIPDSHSQTHTPAGWQEEEIL